MRLLAVSNKVPRMPGTTNHFPCGLARYSSAGLTAPFRASTSAMTSSTGSSALAYCPRSQADSP